MTGGDPITARFMRQDNFTFKPNFKLTIIGNHKPQLLETSMMRPGAGSTSFRSNRKPVTADKHLEEKLMLEAPGNPVDDRWLPRLQANGLVWPASVVAATESYFEDQDLMSQWLEDECDAEPGSEFKRELVALLFGSWTVYCTKAGEKLAARRASVINC